MKKTLTKVSLVVVMTMLATNLSATVHRVSNVPGASANFTTLQAAVNAAADGDTIYLEGSATAYPASFNIAKKIIIIGPGYFITQNPYTQANTYPATINGNLLFVDGSSGSKLMGVTMANIVYLGNTSNITIERNRFAGGYSVSHWTGSSSNISILNNYFDGFTTWASVSLSNSNNVIIANNYIFGTVTLSAGVGNAFIVNNILRGNVNVNNTILTNNLMMEGTFTHASSVFTHNLANGTQFGNQNNNQQNVDMGTVFVGLTGNSPDGQWQLAPGSPAIGAGEFGVDCGIYGGVNPYRLSGMPPVPSVYELSATAAPTNTINVSVKAKSHD
jgi:hypothetical protein